MLKKYKSSIHNIAFSTEKKVVTREMCTDQTTFTSKNSPEQF